MMKNSRLSLLCLNTGGIATDNYLKGLAGKRSTIFRWLRNEIKSDIYLLQELNSPTSPFEIKQWEKQWGGEVYLNSGDTRAQGVGIFFHPSFNPELVPEYPSIAPVSGPCKGRLITVTILINKEPTSLICLYAPSGDPASVRAEFFKEVISLTSHLPNPIYSGDFNYIDDLYLDKSHNNTDYGQQGGKEWMEFTAHSHLQDPYRVLYPDRRDWSHHGPTLSNRIDRFYMDEEKQGSVERVSHILCPMVHDHRAVKLTILQANGEVRGHDRWFFNNSNLQNPTYLSHISCMIKEYKLSHPDKTQLGGAAAWLDNLLSYLREVTKAWDKDRAHAARRERDAMLRELNYLLHVQSNSKNNKQLNETIKLNREEIAKLEQQACYGAKVRSRSTFNLAHEKPTKIFMGLEKSRAKRSQIHSMRDDSNPSIPVDERPVHSDEEGKREIFKDYYTKLFSEKPTDPDEMSEAASLLNTLEESVAAALELDLTPKELAHSLSTFHNGKAPGPDGFSPDFWKHFWDDLHEPLLDACNESFKTMHMSDLMSTGYISVLFKKQDRKDVTKYRPLTLLPVHYKILTKALTIRLATVIKKLCDPSQTGFIAGRYIMENIRLITDMIEHCDESDIPAYWIFLDMEKAYDRCSWQYLHACMKSAGFGKKFRRWITLLYPLDPKIHPDHYRELGLDPATLSISELKRQVIVMVLLLTHCHSSVGWHRVIL
jgi:exonuclease III